MENGITKHVGVIFLQKRNKWRANIKVQGKTWFLGEFINIDDAIAARKHAEEMYAKPVREARNVLELDIVNEYINGSSQKQLGEKYDFDQSTIHDILKKHHIETRDNTISLDSEKIKNMYDVHTIQEISDGMGVAHGTIRSRLVDEGVSIRPNRKYDIDETIFENVDCEWKAYYLGLFYADGGIGKNNVILSLQFKDIELINKLNEIVYGGNFSLKQRLPQTFINKQTGKCFNSNGSNVIYINSKKVVSDLEKLGCGRRKSLTLQFPNEAQVPDKYMNHFIRGYFDGDGCIQKSNYMIISSDDYCNQFNKWLLTILNINSYVHKCGKVSRLFVHKKDDLVKLKKFMYENSTIYLTRKFDKFVSLGY